jgi:MYXO-CTERM domain-containing protein
MVPRALENGGWRMGSAMAIGLVLALVATPAAAGQLPCGDGTCGVDEGSDVCPSDCPPCGVIAAGGGTIDDGDACYGLFGPQEYWRHEVAGEAGDLAWTMVTAETSASNYARIALHFAEAGRYRVEANVVTGFASTTAARYAITSAVDPISVAIDQSTQQGWVSLGEHEFAAGGHEQSIYVGDNTGESEDAQLQLCLDAFRITRLDAPAGDDSGSDESESGDESGSGGGEDESSAGEDDDTEGAPATDDSGSEGGATNSLPPGFSEGDEDGCGCSTDSTGGAWLWGLLALPLARRRRGSLG